jgi:hypothetical protein
MMSENSGHHHHHHHRRKLRFTRTKTGCQPCKLRRKKCDEQKPVCVACDRNKLICSWPENDDLPKSSIPASESREVRRQSQDANNSPSRESDEDLDAEISFGNSRPKARTISASSQPLLPSSYDIAAINLIRAYQPLLEQPQPAIYGALRLPQSRILFEYYYNKTAGRVSAHPQNFNPFIQQLMPWALSNDLILQSLLAWSGSHLSYIVTEVQETTCMHYAQAIRGVKHGLTRHATGEQEIVLPLLISTLMLCFIEVSFTKYY